MQHIWPYGGNSRRELLRTLHFLEGLIADLKSHQTRNAPMNRFRGMEVPFRRAKFYANRLLRWRESLKRRYINPLLGAPFPVDPLNRYTIRTASKQLTFASLIAYAHF